MTETVVTIYDKTSKNWSEDPEINRLFLTAIFNYCFDQLKHRGHLFVNDVHDQLGLSRTPRGQLIGWLWTEKGEFWEWEKETNRPGPVEIKLLTQGEIYEKI